MLHKVSCVPIFARLLLLLDEGLFNWCQLQMCLSPRQVVSFLFG